jgi:hypothetical protein
MASQTPNLGLTLPIGPEKVSRQIINSNNGIIDSAFGNIVSPTVQGVSTLAELKTYLLAVAGSAEARKNVPVQFNFTASASPFNSGLYTGIMQKETNGAFSVLCHGYNGGVVEVQYASSTWTIMNLTSEISSLNDKIISKNITSGTILDTITSMDRTTMPKCFSKSGSTAISDAPVINESNTYEFICWVEGHGSRLVVYLIRYGSSLPITYRRRIFNDAWSDNSWIEFNHSFIHKEVTIFSSTALASEGIKTDAFDPGIPSGYRLANLTLEPSQNYILASYSKVGNNYYYTCKNIFDSSITFTLKAHIICELG